MQKMHPKLVICRYAPYAGIRNLLWHHPSHAAQHTPMEVHLHTKSSASKPAARGIAKRMECYGCNQELTAKAEQLRSGQWITQCVSCGLINKLTQYADGNGFSVSGALVVVKRD